MWETEDVSAPVENVVIQTAVDRENIHITEIKYQMCQQFAKKLFEMDAIDISKEPLTHNPFSTDVYRGRIKIVRSPGISNVMFDKQVYKFGDMLWSNNQINSALKNTYPEYFL